MRHIRVTCDAEVGLEQIWHYIARDSVDAANRFLEQLTTRFVVIGASPKKGRVRDELKPGLRSHTVGNYITYYRETERTFPYCTSCMERETPSECLPFGNS